MFIRTLTLTILTMLVGSVASASIQSADDSVFGVGALTRDTGQGLDFLDLTFSTNRSFNDVSTSLV